MAAAKAPNTRQRPFQVELRVSNRTILSYIYPPCVGGWVRRVVYSVSAFIWKKLYTLTHTGKRAQMNNDGNNTKCGCALNLNFDVVHWL